MTNHWKTPCSKDQLHPQYTIVYSSYSIQQSLDTGPICSVIYSHSPVISLTLSPVERLEWLARSRWRTPDRERRTDSNAAEQTPSGPIQ